MSSLSFVFSYDTLASAPAASSQPVKLNLQTYLPVIQSRPPPAVGSFNLSTVSMAPYLISAEFFLVELSYFYSLCSFLQSYSLLYC